MASEARRVALTREYELTWDELTLNGSRRDYSLLRPVLMLKTCGRCRRARGAMRRAKGDGSVRDDNLNAPACLAPAAGGAP